MTGNLTQRTSYVPLVLGYAAKAQQDNDVKLAMEKSGLESIKFG